MAFVCEFLVHIGAGYVGCLHSGYLLLCCWSQFVFHIQFVKWGKILISQGRAILYFFNIFIFLCHILGLSRHRLNRLRLIFIFNFFKQLILHPLFQLETLHNTIIKCLLQFSRAKSIQPWIIWGLWVIGYLTFLARLLWFTLLSYGVHVDDTILIVLHEILLLVAAEMLNHIVTITNLV